MPPTCRTPSPPSNTLIVQLPPLLFSPDLLALFQLHFASYGRVISWTPLPKYDRVVVVYQQSDDAREARDEMDGFVWEDEHELQQLEAESNQPSPQPLHILYGPTFTIYHAASSTSEQQDGYLLTVPSSGKNFLISPPGSPPVGWEQTSEEAPNSTVFHREDDIEPVQLSNGKGGSNEFSGEEAWAEELGRALRFLSVDAGGGSDDEDEPLVDVVVDDDQPSMTHLVLPPSSAASRPAVTVSSPAPSSTATRVEQGHDKPRDISQVKATLESMLGRKRSMSDLRRRSRTSSVSSVASGGLVPDAGTRGESALSVGAGEGGGARITPTARPPLA
ncbi:hypothetical protein JCM11641_002213 [Rhodosporidiobolus odoratus]